jgi:hypothetical protein
VRCGGCGPAPALRPERAFGVTRTRRPQRREGSTLQRRRGPDTFRVQSSVALSKWEGISARDTRATFRGTRALMKGVSMPHMGKSHLIIMFTVGPDDVAEGDRIFASHGDFMKGHPREGDAALLSYSISKGPELSNPMDASSEPTGNTIFVVDECYETPAGIARHWQDTTENWPEMASAAPAWFAKAKIVTLHNGTIVQAL